MNYIKNIFTYFCDLFDEKRFDENLFGELTNGEWKFKSQVPLHNPVPYQANIVAMFNFVKNK